MSSFNYLYLVYGAMAFFPALIWLIIIFSKHHNKKVQLLIFLFGAISVIPIFLIEFFFQKYPTFDFINKADQLITNTNLHFLLIYVWVGISEEIIKQLIIRYLDGKYLLVQTINDSIRISCISALGFSFAENIFYFYQIGTNLGLQSLLVAYLFRSTFTTCAHLVFSGFFGYYYGIAKFSISIVEHFNLQGKKFWFSRLIGRILNISRLQAYQEATILKGLFIAITLHAFYDYLLELNSISNQSVYIFLSALLISISYLLLRHLIKNRAGHLILTQDASEEGSSSMAKTDEEVVIELLALWFKQGNYVDVIHICERLLKRDPGNKVVKLFKATAIDKMDVNNPYKLILSKLFPGENSYSLTTLQQKAQTLKQNRNSKPPF